MECSTSHRRGMLTSQKYFVIYPHNDIEELFSRRHTNRENAYIDRNAQSYENNSLRGIRTPHFSSLMFPAVPINRGLDESVSSHLKPNKDFITLP